MTHPPPLTARLTKQQVATSLHHGEQPGTTIHRVDQLHMPRPARIGPTPHMTLIEDPAIPPAPLLLGLRLGLDPIRLARQPREAAPPRRIKQIPLPLRPARRRIHNPLQLPLRHRPLPALLRHLRQPLQLLSRPQRLARRRHRHPRLRRQPLLSTLEPRPPPHPTIRRPPRRHQPQRRQPSLHPTHRLHQPPSILPMKTLHLQHRHRPPQLLLEPRQQIQHHQHHRSQPARHTRRQRAQRQRQTCPPTTKRMPKHQPTTPLW